jgi:hypothetical protein
MRLRLITLLLGLLAVVVPLMPEQAHALSCLHPKEQLDHYALIVEAQVVKTTPATTSALNGFMLGSRHTVTLDVSRYFKGDGPTLVEFVYSSVGWRKVPHSTSRVIIGLDYDPETHQYYASECSLLISPTPTDEFEQELLALVQDRYGEGRAPENGQLIRVQVMAFTPPVRGVGLLWGTMGGLVLLVGAIYARRTR